MRIILSVALLCTYFQYVRSATSEDVERLFTDKLDKSNRMIRPVLNQSDVIDVKFRVVIVAMTDLNEVQQKVEATLWLEVKWQNELLAWNKSEYGDLEVVYPPPENMWRPDLCISNGYNELNPLGLDFVIMKIFHTGLTVWMPGQKVEFLCQIDVTNFPFDTQTCSISFFNWGGTKEESTLDYIRSSDMDRIKALHPNSEWEITDRQYTRNTYGAHEKVILKLTLKRKSTSLVLTILLPVFLLSFLNVFVFLLPTESGEKLSFAVTVLLSQAVFLSFISGMMPQTSDSISGLSIFISTQLVLSTLYVLITCCILRLYHRNTCKRPLPSWFLKIICLSSKNMVNPIGTEEKKAAFGEWVASGQEVSQRLDKIFFWVFFSVVAFMTTLYVCDGLSS